MSDLVIRQRADLTHKHNVMNGRLGWLRLTPAYSVKVVEEIICLRPVGSRILDPFSGTATTPLCAALMNHQATAIDINPFLVWLGRAKVAFYTQHDIDDARQSASQILHMLSSNTCGSADDSAIPPLFNIKRWWNTQELSFLCRLKSCIETSTQMNSSAKTLLSIAFCRTMIRISNASFDHQSMSFKDSERKGYLQPPLYDVETDNGLIHLFREDAEYILRTAIVNPKASVEIVEGDSREVGKCLHGHGPFDLIVTSPPYPNRMSYIREVRPYMYWLDYFQDAREAGELDWKAIGGTWGIATSRLSQWQQNGNAYRSPYFNDVIARVSSSENSNGRLLARYIEKYFEDVWFHLESIVPSIVSGGEVHYIVGNSTFYEVLLPVEQIYRDMLLELGFRNVSIKTLRKRNSKKELYEYVVCGHKA